MPRYRYDSNSGAFEVFPTTEEKQVGNASSRIERLIKVLKKKNLLTNKDINYIKSGDYN